MVIFIIPRLVLLISYNLWDKIINFVLIKRYFTTQMKSILGKIYILADLVKMI